MLLHGNMLKFHTPKDAGTPNEETKEKGLAHSFVFHHIVLGQFKEMFVKANTV